MPTKRELKSRPKRVTGAKRCPICGTLHECWRHGWSAKVWRHGFEKRIG